MIEEIHKTSVDILVLDTKTDQESSLRVAIPELLHRFKQVTSLDSARTELSTKDYMILMVMMESESNSLLPAISELSRDYPKTAIIAAVNSADQQLAAKAIKAGASDYLLEPINSDILHSKIAMLAESKNNMSELMMLRQQIAMNYGFDNFVGVSLKIERIRKTAMQMALCDIPVVISGAAGTGKSLLANIIHYHSLRRKNDFSTIDCSGAGGKYIETEIRKIFDPVAAEAGTIFISHLQNMEIELQKLLAQLITSRQNESVKNGQSRMPRLIISCNQPLYNLVRKQLVSGPLMETLQAIEISIPPLINRIEDIEILSSNYLRKHAFENESQAPAITSSAIEKLSKHDWPGNVRELENCLKRAATICSEKNLDAGSISFIESSHRNGKQIAGDKSGGDRNSSLADSQRLHITRALDENNWNFTHTALQLGIGRTTLWRKVRKFKLQRNEESEAETLGEYSDELHQ